MSLRTDFNESVCVCRMAFFRKLTRNIHGTATRIEKSKVLIPSRFFVCFIFQLQRAILSLSFLHEFA